MNSLPNFLTEGDLRGTENTEETKTAWNGPSAEVMLGLATSQPGAKMRRHGVKFQCAGCRAEGHDKSMDNACVFLDGRFSCAVGGAQHRAAIASQLKIPVTFVEPPRPMSAATLPPLAPLSTLPPLAPLLSLEEMLRLSVETKTRKAKK